MFDLETIVAMNQPKVTALKVGEQRKPEVSAQTATYRIHTEDKARPTIYKLAGKRFDGFTVTTGTGYYKGVEESTLILEIITSDSASIYLLAEEIRKANGQESVLVNRIESSAVSVEMGGLISL
jgi:hypothetical protein